MKNLDAFLIALTAAVWAALATMYAVIPMIHMPPSIRVWGAGAAVFLLLAVVVAAAGRVGGPRRVVQRDC